MKPAILIKIDQIIDANLDMTIVASAESAVVFECQAWLATQPGFEEAAERPALVYREINIMTSSAPLGGDGFVVKAVTK